MKEGPDISQVATLIGDPARANMLTALMAGKALTAGELAGEAGITLPTASGHLRKLETGGLILARKQGRHKYFTLAGPEIAHLLEVLMGFASARGHLRTRTGPRDGALRGARVCYNHLAGEAGVQMFDAMMAREYLGLAAQGLTVTDSGRRFVTDLGIDLDGLQAKRRPLCRECLDWSERRSHLAGSLGRGLFELMLRENWLEKTPGTRIVTFRPSGLKRFTDLFGPPPPL
ncbi:ArsR/SmtB family transcription factor [Rhodospirillum rubrum]|uniref:Transcriptional regulator, ArsR family n=1 Tax=Rhodospirillum rubrum (strain ATCC 11170 / ATH 1.1.1 / DSM 467 / LMG 4362 / NCIMB 8255 / S1) TaxID=269796 RepID=Q2RXF4_RHORT|nr:winged helix-turn-helix domain-containing protein [Rhodospirillum rubrum]ABC21191.1 transcriptional regulator, ArsR family [Rhodospirillum rubrum ATCC 11170]AEO46865.1 ArsR family transcriptional regulator [Rhodospirillum rubrum F11]MBK5952739.1 transcriptional regulator [Rhodospirillum rubrum]QXG80882.1 winged helix-turn-helix domain-containing protein [Rhodospirillum rubrum]